MTVSLSDRHRQTDKDRHILSDTVCHTDRLTETQTDTDI